MQIHDEVFLYDIAGRISSIAFLMRWGESRDVTAVHGKRTIDRPSTDGVRRAAFGAAGSPLVLGSTIIESRFWTL